MSPVCVVGIVWRHLHVHTPQHMPTTDTVRQRCHDNFTDHHRHVPTFIWRLGEIERGGLEVKRNTRARVIYTPVFQLFHLRADGDAHSPKQDTSVPKCDRPGNVFRVSAESRGFCTLSRCLPLSLGGESQVWAAARCTATDSRLLLVTSVTAEQQRASYLGVLQDVIEAIAESAFKTSQYPVILSFENHVDT